MKIGLLDKLIKETSEELGLDLDVVDKVISFQWESTNKALSKYKEVEITGLGRFYTKDKKIKEKLKILQKYRNAYIWQLGKEENPKKRNTLQLRLDTANSDIEFLKSKLNEKDTADY